MFLLWQDVIQLTCLRCLVQLPQSAQSLSVEVFPDLTSMVKPLEMVVRSGLVDDGLGIITWSGVCMIKKATERKEKGASYLVG